MTVLHTGCAQVFVPLNSSFLPSSPDPDAIDYSENAVVEDDDDVRTSACPWGCHNFEDGLPHGVESFPFLGCASLEHYTQQRQTD